MSARGGSRAEACPGGHIGPPLRDAGNVPEITEIGTENEHSPCGAGRSPPPLQKNGSKLVHGGVRLGCGFRQPNSETEFGASVMVTPPYGCVTGSAQQRADVGIGPYALRRTARRGRRATGGCGEPPRLPWPAAHSGAFVPAGARKWVGIAAEIIPKVSSNLGQSLSHGEAVTAPVVPKAWPPPTKRRWRLGRRSRCPKFFARIRSQNFDRCHSFLLASSATGGARKRPPLHKGAFGDGGYAIGASARWASSQ